MHVICPKMHSNQHQEVTGGPHDLISDPNGEAVRSILDGKYAIRFILSTQLILVLGFGKSDRFQMWHVK